MLQTDTPTETRSYLVIVEQQVDVSDDSIVEHLSDSLNFMEGTGSIDVVPMGLYEEESVPTSPVVAFDTLTELGL
jgi:hypothetical protein